MISFSFSTLADEVIIDSITAAIVEPPATPHQSDSQALSPPYPDLSTLETSLTQEERVGSAIPLQECECLFTITSLHSFAHYLSVSDEPPSSAAEVIVATTPPVPLPPTQALSPPLTEFSTTETCPNQEERVGRAGPGMECEYRLLIVSVYVTHRLSAADEEKPEDDLTSEKIVVRGRLAGVAPWREFGERKPFSSASRVTPHTDCYSTGGEGARKNRKRNLRYAKEEPRSSDVRPTYRFDTVINQCLKSNPKDARATAPTVSSDVYKMEDLLSQREYFEGSIQPHAIPSFLLTIFPGAPVKAGKDLGRKWRRDAESQPPSAHPYREEPRNSTTAPNPTPQPSAFSIRGAATCSATTSITQASGSSACTTSHTRPSTQPTDADRAAALEGTLSATCL